jgi:hypothetical protein
MALLGELVTEQFEISQGYADTTMALAIQYLNDLKAVSIQDIGEFIDMDADYDWPDDITIDADMLVTSKPTAPSEADLEFGTLTLPSVPTFIEITTPTLPNEPATTFAFSESAYSSDLWTQLKAKIAADLAAGGTGLGATIEADIWNRAKARTVVENGRVRDQLESGIAARGFTLPTGALQAAIAEAIIEETRANSDINEKIAIEQARLAQENNKVQLDSAIRVETLSVEENSQRQLRVLDAAKAAVSAGIEMYNGLLNGCKLQVDVKAAVNKGRLDNYLGQVEATKLELQYITSRIDAVVKSYLASAEVYKASVQAGTADLEAQVKVYEGQLEKAKAEANVTIESGKATLEAYIANRQLMLETVKAGAQVCSQLAASAMSAVHASAAGSYGFSYSYRPDSANEISISESTSHNYNYSE